MKPITAWLSSDGHVFLPVSLPPGVEVHFCLGNDKAKQACEAHEKLKAPMPPVGG